VVVLSTAWDLEPPLHSTSWKLYVVLPLWLECCYEESLLLSSSRIQLQLLLCPLWYSKCKTFVIYFNTLPLYWTLAATHIEISRLLHACYKCMWHVCFTHVTCMLHVTMLYVTSTWQKFNILGTNVTRNQLFRKCYIHIYYISVYNLSSIGWYISHYTCS